MRYVVPLLLIIPIAAWAQRPEQMTLADMEGDLAKYGGVVRDTDIVHSGDASARWSDHPHNPTVTFDEIPSDWTRFENLEFWLHSEVANDAQLMVIIPSQNADTEGADYWWKKITVNWTGWRHFRIARKSLGEGARQPRGWDHVDRLTLRASWGCEPKSDTLIRIDDVRLTNDIIRAAITATQGERTDGIFKTTHGISVTNRADDTVVVRARINTPEGVHAMLQPHTLSVEGSVTRSMALKLRFPTDALPAPTHIASQSVDVTFTTDKTSGGTRIKLPIPMIQILFAALQRLPHPRLFVNSGILDDLRERAENHDRSREIAEHIVSYSDGIIRHYADGIPESELTGVVQGEKLLFRAKHLGMAFLLTGKEEYAHEAARLIAASKNWSSWVRPSHIGTMKADLKTASALRHFATAYDWAYSGMSVEERHTCREAINIGLDLWKQAIDERVFWSRESRTNWCGVCCGGGGIAAIALLGERQDAPKLLAEAYWRIVEFLNEGGIDGGWPEGVSYWGLGLSYAGLFAEATKIATGGAIDLFAHPYLQATCQFPLYMHCPPSGAINFADCYYQLPHQLLTLQLGRQTNNPYAVWYYRKYPGRGVLDLLWDTPDLKGQRPADIPQSIHFRGIDWAVLRSGWDDDATIFGIRGGNNGEHHGMLECTNFVINSRSKRLIVDHGKPQYGPGYFGARRWQFYRANSHGSNVILVDDKDQRPGKDAAGQIHDFLTSRHIDYLRLDATAAYPEFVQSLERRVLFIKPDLFVILDNVRSDTERRYQWRCHPNTEKNVDLGDDRMTVQSGDAGLAVRWLLPKALNIVEGGEDAAGWENDGSDYHIKVVPQERSTSMQFLTAFRCVDAGGASVAHGGFPLDDDAVVVVDVTGGVGCRFADVLGGLVAAFSTGDEPLEVGPLRADATAVVSGGAATDDPSDDLLAAINAARIDIGDQTLMTADPAISFALRPEPGGNRETGVVATSSGTTVKLRLADEYSIRLRGKTLELSPRARGLRTLRLPRGTHEIMLERTGGP